MRAILTVLSAVILSFVLLAVSVVAVGHLSRGGRLDRDSSVLSQSYANVKAKYGDPWQLMSQTAHLYKYGVLPTIALIAGGFVGLFAKRREVLLSCLAILPLAVFVLAALSFSGSGFLLTAVYVLLASSGAGAVSLFKNRGTAVQATR